MAIHEGSPRTPEEIIAEYERSKKKSRDSRHKTFLFVFIGAVALFVIGSALPSDEEKPINIQTITDTIDDQWIPAGFNGYSDDSNIAWRWATESETDCTYSSGACWSIILLAKEGCARSLYGEVNIFDKNDLQISYTNDSLGSVQPMQKVKLTFDTLNNSAQSANVSRFNCY